MSEIDKVIEDYDALVGFYAEDMKDPGAAFSNITAATAELAALRAERDALRECVEKYADLNNWDASDDLSPAMLDYWLPNRSGFTLAAETLDKIEKEGAK